MWSKVTFRRWIKSLHAPAGARRGGPAPVRNRLRIERLEDRTTPTAGQGTQPVLSNGLDPQMAAAAQLDVNGPSGQKDGPLAAIGFDLAYLTRQYTTAVSLGMSSSTFAPANSLLQVVNGLVAVDALPSTDTADMLANLSAVGFRLVAQSAYSASGFLPISSLTGAAALSSVRQLSPSYRPVMNVGTVDSQGVTAIGSAQVNQFLGLDGTGSTVGVISDSYNALGGAAADVASGNLPGAGNPFGLTTPVNVVAEGAGGTDEGRAMLQVVHDVAPGAALAFATAGISQTQFAANILALANAGVNVITDDVTFPAEPMFQDGPIAQAVDQVVKAGVSYFAAAGNQGRNSYQSAFRNSGVNLGTGPGGTGLVTTESTFFAQNFAPAGQPVDIYQTVTIGPGTTTISFQWSNPFFSVSGGAGAQTDMDMAVFDSAGNFLSTLGGFTRNVGGDAVEVFSIANPGSTPMQIKFAIGKFSGADPALIKYVAFGTGFHADTYATNSSTVYGHANAAGAMAVGAAFYANTPAFGAGPPALESFSGYGGTPILFDTAGNPVTVTRQSLGVVAPDGVNTTFFGQGDIEPDGFPNFSGTSAAAPHVAGVAALMLQVKPSLSPSQVYGALEATAIDMGPAGYDDGSGWGLVQAAGAVEAVGGPFAVTFNGTAGDDAMLVRRDAAGNTEFLLGGVVQFSIPASEVLSISVLGHGGSDALTVDYANGDPVPSGGLTFGNDGPGAADRLTVTGYNVDALTVTHAGSASGTVQVGTAAPLISFSQTAAVTLAGLAADLTIDLPAASPNPDVLLGDDGGSDDPYGSAQVSGLSAVRGSTFAFTRFTSPGGGLTVNLGDGGDTVTLDPMDAAFDPTGAVPLAVNGGVSVDRFVARYGAGNPGTPSRVVIDGGAPTVGVPTAGLVRLNSVVSPNNAVTPVPTGDVLDFLGSGGSVAADLVAGELSEVGGAAVEFTSVETVNVDAGGAAFAVTGATGGQTFQVVVTGSQSGSVYLVTGRMTLTATNAGAVAANGSGSDTLAVVGSPFSDTVTSTATSVTIDGLPITVGTGFGQLSLSTGAGNDTVDLSAFTALPTRVTTGNGNNTVVGSPGNDVIVTGSGSNTIDGGGGSDTVLGGGGSNTLLLTGRAGPGGAFGVQFTGPGAGLATAAGAVVSAVNFSGVTGLLVDGGGAAANSLSVSGTGGNDRFTVTGTANQPAGQVQLNSFPTIAFQNFGANGAVSLNGSGTNNRVTVYEAANWGIATVNVGGGLSGGGNVFAIVGTSADDLFAYTPSTNTLAVQAPAGGPATVYNLAGIGSIRLDGLGQAAADRLVVTEPTNVVPTPGSGTLPTAVPLTYQNVEQVVVHDVPAAANDTATTAQNVPVTVDVLANDAGLGDAPLVLSIVAAPGHGTVAVVGSQIRYTPAPGYNSAIAGPDTFTYLVTDANGESSAATVTVTVTPDNTPPVATPLTLSVREGGSVALIVTGYDGDPDAVPLTFAIVTAPSHGVLTGFDSATGWVTYTPDPGYVGPDSFTFVVYDDGAFGGPANVSLPAAVSIQVTPAPVPPVPPVPPTPQPPQSPPPVVSTPPAAVSQSVSVAADGSVVITLTALDATPGSGQGLTFTIVSGPGHGTLTPLTATSNVGSAQFRYQPAPGYTGPDGYSFTVTDPGSGLTSSPAAVSINVTPAPNGVYAVGTGPGGGPEVRVYDAQTGTLVFDFFAYDSAYRGGVRVAVGDVNGDGYSDIVTATGPGGGPNVKVFSGKDLSVLASFYAFAPSFTGGVSIAAGDFNGDGIDEIVVGAGPGAGPAVRTFQIAHGQATQLPGPLGSFFAYAPSFTGGINVAAGNFDGLPGDEIITGAASLGGPHVMVFSATRGKEASFFAFPNSVLGVSVAAADLDGDGKAEIITGPGVGGGPVVQIFSGGTATPRGEVAAYDADFRGGIWVATATPTGTRKTEIVVAPVTGASPVEVFDGETLNLIDLFDPYTSEFTGGIFVGGK